MSDTPGKVMEKISADDRPTYEAIKELALIGKDAIEHVEPYTTDDGKEKERKGRNLTVEEKQRVNEWVERYGDIAMKLVRQLPLFGDADPEEMKADEAEIEALEEQLAERKAAFDEKYGDRMFERACNQVGTNIFASYMTNRQIPPGTPVGTVLTGQAKKRGRKKNEENLPPGADADSDNEM